MGKMKDILPSSQVLPSNTLAYQAHVSLSPYSWSKCNCSTNNGPKCYFSAIKGPKCHLNANNGPKVHSSENKHGLNSNVEVQNVQQTKGERATKNTCTWTEEIFKEVKRRGGLRLKRRLSLFPNNIARRSGCFRRNMKGRGSSPSRARACRTLCAGAG